MVEAIAKIARADIRGISKALGLNLGLGSLSLCDEDRVARVKVTRAKVAGVKVAGEIGYQW
jgi:hypothetical protein